MAIRFGLHLSLFFLICLYCLVQSSNNNKNLAASNGNSIVFEIEFLFFSIFRTWFVLHIHVCIGLNECIWICNRPVFHWENCVWQKNKKSAQNNRSWDLESYQTENNVNTKKRYCQYNKQSPSMLNCLLKSIFDCIESAVNWIYCTDSGTQHSHKQSRHRVKWQGFWNAFKWIYVNRPFNMNPLTKR